MKTSKPIIIFTHGYVDSEKAFEKMTSFLVENYPSMIEYPFINLDNLHMPAGDSIKMSFADELSEIQFHKTVKKFAKFALKYSKKSILLRLRLCGKDYAASVEEQALRLVYLIRHLYILSPDRPLVLVGHSQGGLVNLLASSYLDAMVDQVISINTPYRNVQAISEFFALYKRSDRASDALRKFLSNSVPNLTEESEEKLTAAGIRFTNNKMSNEIKERFSNLTYPPRLDVICSISGIFNGSVFNWRRAYDGFITVYEMQDVDYDERHILSEKTLPCIKEERTVFNVYSRCLTCHDCELVEFNFRSLIHDLRNKIPIPHLINSVLDGSFDAINNRGHNNELNIETYDIFYETYSGGYDHFHISENPLTAKKIIEILEQQKIL